MYIVYTIYFYLTSKLYYIFTSRIIYDPNALTRDHANNFWDTSTPICQTESLTGIYTGPLYIYRKNLNNNFKNITAFEDLRFLALDRKEWKKLEDI